MFSYSTLKTRWDEEPIFHKDVLLGALKTDKPKLKSEMWCFANCLNRKDIKEVYGFVFDIDRVSLMYYELPLLPVTLSDDHKKTVCKKQNLIIYTKNDNDLFVGCCNAKRDYKEIDITRHQKDLGAELPINIEKIKESDSLKKIRDLIASAGGCTFLPPVKINKKYHLFLHRTHNNKFRLILPFNSAFIISKIAFKKAYVQCSIDIGLTFDDYDESCCHDDRFYYWMPDHHTLKENKGSEKYTPALVISPSLATPVVEYNAYQIEGEQAIAMLERVVSFYEYYKTKIDWSSIKTKQCQLGLHDMDVPTDITFNNSTKDNGHEPNIFCHHTSCYKRLMSETELFNAEDNRCRRVKDYTVLYLFALIQQGKLHIHQLEACAIDKVLHPWLKRMNKLKFHPKIDAPSWVKYLHVEIVYKNKFFHGYKNGIYIQYDDEDLENFYNTHAGTYMGYRTHFRKNSVKSKLYINETLTYINACAADNTDIIKSEDGMVLNNKLLTFEKGKVMPQDHSPEIFLLKKEIYDYDEYAKCPIWLQTLKDYFGDKEAPQIKVLQEFFGYCLTYDSIFEKFLVIFGESRGGKNTIGELLMSLVGGVSTNCKDLQNPKEREDMVGKKIVFIDEAMDCNNVRSMNNLKKMVSTGPIEIRPMHRKKYDLINKPKLIMCFNDPPNDLKIDKALRNRMLTLKVTVSFYGRENINLKGQLKRELSGILNWAIEGHHRLYANNKFTFYDEATQELYDHSNEEILEIADFLRSVKRGKYSPTDLLNQYREWNDEFRDKHTYITFGKILTQLGYKKKTDYKTNRKMYDLT